MKEVTMGYAVDALSVEESIDEIYYFLRHAQRFDVGGRHGSKTYQCRWLACLNPHSYAVAKSDTHFEMALSNADWLVGDGVGIVIASWVLGGRLRVRVTGSDIFYGLTERLANSGGARVFFLGSAEDTLQLIKNRMNREYPNIEVVGTYSPPYKDFYSSHEIDEIVATVNAARPDVLWVGLTAPKQEKLIQACRDRWDVTFAGAIGAVFDFYAGKVQRSSRIFQRCGLEWLPRLIQQPRRLWKRMLVSAPIFLWDLIRARVSRIG
ncbi:WecB/TagA/CpsF family glycosyltransferase [Halomonas sp. KM-1]|uniref:WecB/TagA/CpsF family glycosyltransferase n=1 Tax=Halomonas sp. KM-1 TaxID=590061 RepID=UPI001930BF27|nr:WecB/TagA/CpsF family glycosyltransferase [Halomonas sp. KM-1]